MKSNTKSKRNYKLSKIQRNKKHLTKKNKRYNKYKKYKGGHPNEDLEHYHLHIKLPSGATKEIPERFLHTTKIRRITSVTIKDIQEFVVDQIGDSKPFTLFWKGKKMVDPKIKLRKIVVNQTKIEPHKPNVEDPIIVFYNEDIGDPVNYEAHDIDWGDPDT